jgi:hypothetical protein
MSFRSKVKKVIPKVDLQSYTILICGNYKSGKTRLWKELIDLNYPNDPDAGLLLAFEAGYNTWELESVVDMHNYDWNFFRNEVVKGLVAEAKQGSPTKVIGIDTLDKCIDMCTDWVLSEAQRKYGKKFTSLQDISNQTNENGYTLVQAELNKQFDALKNAGYGFIWLAWTKFRETELIDGMKYAALDLMMSPTYQKVFRSQADLICCLHNDVKVLDRDGNVLEENLTNKKGKEIASYFHESTTYMYFKENNFISVAGGRFFDLPEKVEYGAENFMKVFEEAVKGQLRKTKQSVEELREKEIEEREEKAKEFATQQEEQENAKKKKADLITEIKEKLGSLTQDKKSVAVKKANEILGTTNFSTINDIDKLQKFLEALNAI